MDQVLLHRVKECCIQLHSNVQMWKEISSKGFDLANQIVNLNQEKKYTEESSHFDAIHSGASDLSGRLCSKVILQRETLFLQLKEIEDNLENVVDKLGALVVNLKASVELALSSHHAPEKPFFATLPPDMFGIYSEELYGAYCQEMSLKKDVIRDLLHQTDRDTLTLYLSCWLHEPYLTNHTTECLEAMLIDCGLRS